MRSDCNEGERKGAEREGASVGVEGQAHRPRAHVPLPLLAFCVASPSRGLVHEKEMQCATRLRNEMRTRGECIASEQGAGRWRAAQHARNGSCEAPHTRWVASRPARDGLLGDKDGDASIPGMAALMARDGLLGRKTTGFVPP